MKIVLIAPHSDEVMKGFPLGLAYIAGALKDRHQLFVLDLSARVAVEQKDPNEILTEELLRFRPDIVGITSTSPTHLSATETAKVVKETLGDNVKVIKGGPHETNCAPTTLKYHPEIDISVIGEGEETIQELVAALDTGISLDNIQGIAYRKGDEVIVNPRRALISDLDAIQRPARELLYLNELLQDYYNSDLFQGRKTATMVTSRGCPYSCSFCSSKVNWERKLRTRSVGDVIDEIRKLSEDGFKGFMFEDDMAIANKEWFLDFSEKLKELKIHYSMQTRVNAIDEEVAQALKDSGCAYIYFGVESGVQEILDNCGKRVTVEQARKAFELMRKYNIRNAATIQFGLLGEDLQELTTVRETIRILNEELKPEEVCVSYTSLYPGSDLAVSNGISAEKYERRLTSDVKLGHIVAHGANAIHPQELTDEKIKEIEKVLTTELKIKRLDTREWYSE